MVFDISFFNPIIFYRAVEFSNGGDFSGNVQVGLDLKYRVTDNISLYSQLLIDELRVSEAFDNSGWWANKFAVQLGGKYYNAFKVDGLTLQGEFNWVRPYTFSHTVEELKCRPLQPIHLPLVGGQLLGVDRDRQVQQKALVWKCQAHRRKQRF